MDQTQQSDGEDPFFDAKSHAESNAMTRQCSQDDPHSTHDSAVSRAPPCLTPQNSTVKSPSKSVPSDPFSFSELEKALQPGLAGSPPPKHSHDTRHANDVDAAMRELEQEIETAQGSSRTQPLATSDPFHSLLHSSSSARPNAAQAQKHPRTLSRPASFTLPSLMAPDSISSPSTFHSARVGSAQNGPNNRYPDASTEAAALRPDVGGAALHKQAFDTDDPLADPLQTDTLPGDPARVACPPDTHHLPTTITDTHGPSGDHGDTEGTVLLESGALFGSGVGAHLPDVDGETAVLLAAATAAAAREDVDDDVELGDVAGGAPAVAMHSPSSSPTGMRVGGHDLQDRETTAEEEEGPVGSVGEGWNGEGMILLGGLEMEEPGDEAGEGQEEEGEEMQGSMCEISAQPAVNGAETEVGSMVAGQEDGTVGTVTPTVPPGKLPVSTQASMRALRSAPSDATVASEAGPSTAQDSSPAPLLAPTAGPSGRPDMSTLLRDKKRHYFIISNSGRPIFTRHGSPHESAAFAALVYSLVSLSHNALSETPRVFTAGPLTLTVRARAVAPVSSSPYTPRHTAPYATSPGFSPALHPPASLANVAALTVAVTRAPSTSLPPSILRLHLELLHLQLLAWTTDRYERLLLDNPRLDTASTLAGTAASFELLLKRLSVSLDGALQAVEVLRVPPLLRGAATDALRQAVVDSDALFGIIACGHQLVALTPNPAVPPQHHPHPWDLLLLLNFIAADPSYRSNLVGQQAWVPLCLPKSSPHCFHFVYIHYPDSGSPLFVSLVDRSQQKFFAVHSIREPLMSTLNSVGVLSAVKRSCRRGTPYRPCPADVAFPERLSHLKRMLLQFTVVKSAAHMYVQSAFAPVVSGHKDQKAALQDCMRLHASMWGAATVSSVQEPMPIQWRVCERWALLGIVQAGEYEAFLILDPLTAKHEAITLCNHVVPAVLQNAELWQFDAEAVGASSSSLFG